jgi:hypothetical protein
MFAQFNTIQDAMQQAKAQPFFYFKEGIFSFFSLSVSFLFFFFFSLSL